MTRPLLLVAALLALPLPAGAAEGCALPDAPAPLRRGGTATVILRGRHEARGTFPAVCGAAYVRSAPHVARAGDGLLFATCVPGVGLLQIQEQRRVPGPSRAASLTLDAADGAWIGAGPDNHVTVADDLFGALLRATLRPVRSPADGGPGGEVEVEARFECPAPATGGPAPAGG
jgi:hypothetical protein